MPNVLRDALMWLANHSWVFPVAIALIVVTVIAFHRQTKDYRHLLRERVEKKGYEILKASWPGFFRTGPFPKIRISKGPYVHTHLLGIRGEYEIYRLVRLRSKKGLESTHWVRMRFRAFRLHKVDFNPKI